jgi:hypothetical protein
MSTFDTQSGTSLETWLKRATCRLSADSTAQVRIEIQEHYELAREEALTTGAVPAEAARRALASLGDARAANRLYRKVMLTKAEARLLRETSWEARVLCSEYRWLLPIPVAGLCASLWFLATGQTYLALMLLVGAGGLGLLVSSPLLPIYTPSRARIFRGVRWAWLIAILLLAAWPDILKESWLLAACLWPIAWVEGTLLSLRRKLPVAAWPRQLYL